MPRITFIKPDGDKVVVENAEGSVMQIAVDENLEGIEGACGGVCSCATCHVRVAPEWLERVGPPDELEQELLELEDGTNARSRLSCQIELTAALDGLEVEIVPLQP